MGLTERHYSTLFTEGRDVGMFGGLRVIDSIDRGRQLKEAGWIPADRALLIGVVLTNVCIQHAIVSGVVLH